MKEKARRLNPFTYIPETHVRFYMLIAVSLLLPLIWSYTIVSSMLSTDIIGIENTLLLRVIITIFAISFILFLIYWRYKKLPNKIIKRNKLKDFNKPDQYELIKKLHGKYLAPMQPPTIMHQLSIARSKDAFTFGTKNHIYISIGSGLIAEFRNNVRSFTSIILHEMAHIANRDVEKAYLAISTWRAIVLTLVIVFGIFLVFTIGLALLAIFLALLWDYELSTLIPMMNLGEAITSYIAVFLEFIIFLVIIYVLRNQVIRTREFYADAKVAEWQESPENIIKTLDEISGKQQSRLELLAKFHPNIRERIQVLKNNLSLFRPSLWVSFSIGFLYWQIESNSITIKATILTGSPEMVGYETGFRVVLSCFFFTFLMFAVSTSFHKSALKNIFLDNKIFSTANILNIVKVALVFALGMIYTHVMLYFNLALSNMIYPAFNVGTSMDNLLIIANSMMYQTIFLAISLFFILIFASLLIQRSFSRKESMINFSIITVLSSILYIVNRYVATEIFHQWPLLLAFFLAFSTITYIYVKIKDKKLLCPHCRSKISAVSGWKLDCPKCHQNLYLWAIYPF